MLRGCPKGAQKGALAPFLGPHFGAKIGPKTKKGDFGKRAFGVIPASIQRVSEPREATRRSIGLEVCFQKESRGGVGEGG